MIQAQLYYVITLFQNMLLYQLSEAFYSLKCPVHAHWTHRSESFCHSGEHYFCLYDQNEQNYTEFCRKNPDVEAPGMCYLIVSVSASGMVYV